MGPGLKALLVSLVVVGIAVPMSIVPAFLPAASGHEMARFSSYAELIGFIQAPPDLCSSSAATGAFTRNPGTLSSNTGSITTLTAGPDYSATNVQVQGVDELDTVKTDGQYIYTITNNTLVIVKAYPAVEAGVVSRIAPNGTLAGVFVYGNMLVLIGGAGAAPPYVTGVSVPPGKLTILPFYWYSPSTGLWVYDISNVASPALTFSLQEDGTYVGSRLIDNSVYLVTTQYAIVRNETVTLPSHIVNGQLETTQATQIYHSDVQDYGYSFTTVSRVNLSTSPSLDSQSFLISSSGTLYVSTGNIYLTSTIWTCQEETIIHRVNIGNGGISYEATGIVPGTVKNQFSMDEYRGILRMATSSWAFFSRPLMMMSNTGVSAPSPTSTVRFVLPSPSNGFATNVFTLDMNLRVVGSLEGLAPGEQFHSARFLGDRGYLVTFKKTDPLFVIDLREPTSLRVLGELHVNGYSDYLQPYDETHLIGIGKNATDAEGGTFAWYQGVKVSLFDVTDPANPQEVSNYVIGDRGTTSPALTDSHAVLFDHDHHLLVLPVEVAKLSENNTDPWMWGNPVWQGAYVFSISPDGVVFKGGITHLQNGEVLSYYTNSDHFVNRSLYIGHVLYTISPAMVKMNSLEDLSDLGSVSL